MNYAKVRVMRDMIIMKASLPNEKELEVLTLFYNRFYDLYDEITNDNFQQEDAQLRFSN